MIDVETLRQSARRRAASRPRPPFDGVIRDGHVRGVPTRSYTPCEKMTDAIVYFSHGGYGVFGDLDLQDAYCRRLATVLHRRVVAVDYRLAPENSFFDAVDDLASCVRVQAGTTGVILCGDSAGGAVSVAAGERIGATVRAVMLTNPNLDLTLQSFDRQAPQGPDWELTHRAFALWSRPLPLQEAPEFHRPEKPPPPIFLAVGSEDSLVPEARMLATICASRGWDCELNIVDGRGHGFMSDPGSADLALRRAGAFIRRHLAVP
ncbi:alpha/beta hydrolase [Kocuria rhizophila]|uniref:alpha/beta hydrolase n=1 Tax=Kocuria rhizophila TaxID=72000 RepID=UPI0009EADC90|nr:alpha/beta hydrolase [Kocuria rhizophila]